MIKKILKTVRGFSPVELVIMVGFAALAAGALIFLATTPQQMAQTDPVNINIKVDGATTASKGAVATVTTKVNRQPVAKASATNPDPDHIRVPVYENGELTTAPAKLDGAESEIWVYPTGDDTVVERDINYRHPRYTELYPLVIQQYPNLEGDPYGETNANWYVTKDVINTNLAVLAINDSAVQAKIKLMSTKPNETTLTAFEFGEYYKVIGIYPNDFRLNNISVFAENSVASPDAKLWTKGLIIEGDGTDAANKGPALADGSFVFPDGAPRTTINGGNSAIWVEGSQELDKALNVTITNIKTDGTSESIWFGGYVNGYLSYCWVNNYKMYPYEGIGEDLSLTADMSLISGVMAHAGGKLYISHNYITSDPSNKDTLADYGIGYIGTFYPYTSWTKGYVEITDNVIVGSDFLQCPSYYPNCPYPYYQYGYHVGILSVELATSYLNPSDSESTTVIKRNKITAESGIWAISKNGSAAYGPSIISDNVMSGIKNMGIQLGFPLFQSIYQKDQSNTIVTGNKIEMGGNLMNTFGVESHGINIFGINNKIGGAGELKNTITGTGDNGFSLLYSPYSNFTGNTVENNDVTGVSTAYLVQDGVWFGNPVGKVKVSVKDYPHLRNNVFSAGSNGNELTLVNVDEAMFTSDTVNNSIPGLTVTETSLADNPNSYNALGPKVLEMMKNRGWK